MTNELEPTEAPFWSIDEELIELELQESPSGPQRYSVRLKAHTETSPYHPRKTIYPLQQRGTQVEITGKAYILLPDVTVTVGLFDHPAPSGAIGSVTDSNWQGMRHHEIAKARGLYYAQDWALALWEVNSFGRLDDFTHKKLWIAFEAWLLERFPEAERIFTDDDEPGDDPVGNRIFLRSWGYTQVSQRIFAREVRA
jgi:hypothetical protein